MNPDIEPKLTFWSIPPIRQRFQSVARTIKLRDVRLFIAQVYGGLYLLYGIKVPIVWLFIAPSIIGTTPPAVDLAVAAIPYVLPTAIFCGLISAIAGSGAAWYITGRAMQTRRQSRLRYAIWGALGAGTPILSLVAIAPLQQLPVVGAELIATMLFGAAQGAAFQLIVQRLSAGTQTRHDVNSIKAAFNCQS